MATQVDVAMQAPAPTREPPIFEHRAIAKQPRDLEDQRMSACGHEATDSTNVPDPPRSVQSRHELNTPPNQPPKVTAPNVSPRPGNDVTSNTETRLSQETSSAIGILPGPDPIENVWDHSVPVPCSRQKKLIYLKAPVELDPWSREQWHARFLFVRKELEALVDKHLDLHGLERRPVYTLRMVGTTPSTALPSIVITCREMDAKALQDLFRSRAEHRLYIGKERGLVRWSSSLGNQREKDESIPRLRLVYYRTRTGTVIRRASDEHLTAYLGNDGAYCGGLIQYQEASATLGPSIDIDDMNAILTVGHLFSSNGYPDSSLADDEKIPPSDVSEASTLNDDTGESGDALWEDDDEYDDFDEDDSLDPGRTEGNFPHERTFPGLPGLEEKLTGRDREQWERVVPKAGLSPSSPYLDWALTRPVSHPSLSPSRTNAFFPDGPGGRRVFLDQFLHPPPSHLASVYMVSGVRGILHGQILSGPSFLPSLPGQDYCEAWTIILDNSDVLLSGECGSTVIDRATNKVYGHVVGSDTLGHAYIVPLARVLEQVKACFEAKHVGLASPVKASHVHHLSSPRMLEDAFTEFIEDHPIRLDLHADDDSDDNDDDDEDEARRYDDDEDDDPFGGFDGPPGSLSSTLRALTGMTSGLTSRLRELLQNLRVDDLSVQLKALQELSEILLASNEDSLSGHFSPDAFVKELVILMNKEESPEIMLLACRCLANLMEALPASTSSERNSPTMAFPFPTMNHPRRKPSPTQPPRAMSVSQGQPATRETTSLPSVSPAKRPYKNEPPEETRSQFPGLHHLPDMPSGSPSIISTPGRSFSQPTISSPGAQAPSHALTPSNAPGRPQQRQVPPQTSYPPNVQPGRPFPTSGPPSEAASPWSETIRRHGMGGPLFGVEGQQAFMALPGSDTPLPVQVDYSQASKKADEKRQRNAVASTRHRRKKKIMQEENTKQLRELREESRMMELQIDKLKQQRDFYREDRNRLRDIVAQIPSISSLAVGPPSPTFQSSSSYADSSSLQGYGGDPSTGERPAQRRRTDDRPEFSIPSYGSPASGHPGVSP